MGQEAPLSHITPYIGIVTYLLLLYYTGEQCTVCRILGVCGGKNASSFMIVCF